MKKKLLITSVLSLIMCFSLICGATFALFTSESKVNIAVTSGTVSVTAQVTDGTLKTSTTLSDFTDSGNNDETVYFENGGAAFFDEQSVLNLSDMTPGDIAEFDIDISNESDVTIQYRVTVKVLGELASALTVSVKYYGEETAQTLSGVDATAWTTVKAGDDVSVNDVNITNDIEVTVSFPTGLEDYSNLQDKAASISFTVEAVQGNATVNDSVEVGTVEELASVFAVGGDVKLTQDLALDSYLTVAEGAEVSLDLNGKTLSTPSGNVIRNNGDLTIANGTLESTAAYTINNESTTGSVKVDNVKSVNGGFFNAGSMVVNNCEITNTASGKHALVNSGAASTSLVVNGGTYSTTSANAILYAYSGTIEINDGSFTQIGSSYMIDGSGITINGGTFTDDDGKWTIRGSNMTIKGGTFNFDPTNYLADGYTATANEDGTWTVTVE